MAGIHQNTIHFMTAAQLCSVLWVNRHSRIQKDLSVRTWICSGNAEQTWTGISMPQKIILTEGLKTNSIKEYIGPGCPKINACGDSSVTRSMSRKPIGLGQWVVHMERIYPNTKVWETCTPYFDKRNIHFYVNVCGFHITEFFNEKHPMPDTPDDFVGDGNEGMFAFKKQMRL